MNVDLFWDRVKIPANLLTECWEWGGYINNHGYGSFGCRSDRRRSQKIAAHRMSYSLVVGVIPSGAILMHSCDRPSCVNPAHLRIGTHAENQADKMAKGRQARGERVGTAVMTLAHAASILERRLAGEGGAAIARSMGLNRSTVAAVISGQNWSGNASLKRLRALLGTGENKL